MDDSHYHVWLRRGRVFSMAPRRFESRSTADWWARKRKSAPEDRLVMVCTNCPAYQRARTPKAAAIDAKAAALLKMPAASVRLVRQALQTAKRNLKDGSR